MSKKKRVHLLISDTGSGHRSASNALKQRLLEKGLDWDIRIINMYKEILQEDAEEIYNTMLKLGLGRFYWPVVVPIFRVMIKWGEKVGAAKFQRYFLEHKPDLVVSTSGMTNHVLQNCVRQALPETPFVVMMCDMLDMEKFYLVQQEHYDPLSYAICPSPESAAQARSLGYREAQIVQTSGIPFAPDSYLPTQLNKRVERLKQGLDPDVPTIMLCFGGYASKEVETLVMRLEQLGRPCQIVAMCGHNKTLEQRLRKLKTKNKLVVQGFTKELHYFMQLSDIYIGKPGSSIFFAALMKLPVICELNGRTMLHERGNAEIMQKQGLGMAVDDFRDICSAVNKILEPTHYQKLQENLSLYRNRGVFEVCDFFQHLLEPVDDSADAKSLAQTA
ncbi:MAG TPA: hypothetical protein VFM46_01775 [Pseudomonadales bacterium]|nr:hypothetical protein [Pseudomonadales bacterium]